MASKRRLSREEKTITYPAKSAKDRCGKCGLDKVYDHVSWCRGLSDGYTCRCRGSSDESDEWDGSYIDDYVDLLGETDITYG